MMIHQGRRFWLAYLGVGTALRGSALRQEFDATGNDPPCSITIPFDGTYELEIEMDGVHSLSLRHIATSRIIRLGWMDSHQMSDAFRFEELNEICAASTMSPAWQARVLLSHYVAPTSENIDALVSTFGEALRTSQLFSESEVDVFANYMRRIVREQFKWVQDTERGWIGVVESSKLWLSPFTLRTPENKDFDHRFLNDFLAHLRPLSI